jgi:hypothetical protein
MKILKQDANRGPQILRIVAMSSNRNFVIVASGAGPQPCRLARAPRTPLHTFLLRFDSVASVNSPIILCEELTMLDEAPVWINSSPSNMRAQFSHFGGRCVVQAQGPARPRRVQGFSL